MSRAGEFSATAEGGVFEMAGQTGEDAGGAVEESCEGDGALVGEGGWCGGDDV